MYIIIKKVDETGNSVYQVGFEMLTGEFSVLVESPDLEYAIEQATKLNRTLKQ